jgi:hypothetical protein
MTTPYEPTQITEEDLKDKNPKSMSRRITSAFKKSFSKTMKRSSSTPSKTYIFNKEEDFKDRTKFSNRAGVAPNNTVFWSIILKIDPATINPKISYRDPELKEAVTRVLRNGKFLDREYGSKTASDKRTAALAKWQETARETYLKEKRQKPEISKALEIQDSKNVDDVLDEIQLRIDADESKKQLTARLKQLHNVEQGGRRRRRKTKRVHR